MGGLWWWVHARSAREIRETFAEVEVIDRAEAVERASAQELGEVDIDAVVMPVGLDDLRATRDAQRARSDFGGVAERSVVHLRRWWNGENEADPAIYLMEVGSDGRGLRQGGALRRWHRHQERSRRPGLEPAHGGPFSIPTCPGCRSPRRSSNRTGIAPGTSAVTCTPSCTREAKAGAHAPRPVFPSTESLPTRRATTMVRGVPRVSEGDGKCPC
jgi:hypothetical protein